MYNLDNLHFLPYSLYSDKNYDFYNIWSKNESCTIHTKLCIVLTGPMIGYLMKKLAQSDECYKARIKNLYLLLFTIYEKIVLKFVFFS